MITRIIASISVYHHLLDRQLDEVGGVVGVGVAVAGREALRDLLDPRLDRVGRLQRVGAGREEDGDAGARLAVEPAVGIVILRAQLDAGDIAEAYPRAAGFRLDDDVAELLGGLEARRGGDGGVEHLPRQRRRTADFARRDFDILRARSR